MVRMGGDEFIVVLRSIRRTEVITETAARINQALSTPDRRRWPPAGHHGEHRGGPVSARRRRHGRAAAALGYGDVSGQGPRAQQLPVVQPDHGAQAARARRDRGQSAQRAGTRAVRRALPADRRHPEQPGDALEALLRWKQPTHGGILLPERFIDIAEETGLIVPVGRIRAAAGDARM